MDARSILASLRDGRPVTEDELAWFAEGLADGAVSDAQAGAFAMAVCTRGLGREARVFLTHAMRDSGDVLDWRLDGPVLDKHSTGGVGDCVSLVLAPALAACGAFVPMISGRGLGHTGGTLDKLEAIPGYRTDRTVEQLQAIVAEVGCAIVGASADIAPADRRLYAVRDVTGTVESIDLITASILSKKLAAGLGALVLDVKSGNGAFMQKSRDAAVLAKSLVEVANGAGLKTSALMTDMNEPLASAAGNAVEVVNAVDFLTGRLRDPRLEEVTLALAAEMLMSAALASSHREADAMARDALVSGAAADRFARMVAALGGPADFVDDCRAHLPVAPLIRAVPAPADGFVTAIDTRGLGVAVVALGGGRVRPDDPVDHAVGLSGLAPVCAEAVRGEPLAMVHARSEADAEAAARAVLAAYDIGPARPSPRKPVSRRIGPST